MKTIGDLGEFAFIRSYLKKQFFPRKPNVLHGIGDDCAVVRMSDQCYSLWSADILCEGIHFDLKTTSAEDLGYKCIAVNVSDIASMGGKAEGVLISASIPPKTELEWLKNFTRGVQEALLDYDICVLGGDTSKSRKDLLFSISIQGQVSPEMLKLRSTAKEGDVICVTGLLGASSLGMELLQKKLLERTEGENECIQAHVRPRAHLREGQFLASYSALTAMIDLSDGIGGDLYKIADESDVGFVVDVNKLPLPSYLENLRTLGKKDYLSYALSGGEDYCLLCTIGSDQYEEINKSFKREFSRDLTCVGVVTGKEDKVFLHNGEPIEWLNGYDHFN